MHESLEEPSVVHMEKHRSKKVREVKVKATDVVEIIVENATELNVT